jgi:hypothetical protein
METTENNKGALWLLSCIKALITGSRVYMTTLRLGEEARPTVPTDGEFAAYYAWCFEQALAIKPLLDKFGPAASAMVVSWGLQALNKYLEDLAKAGKLAIFLLALLAGMLVAAPAVAADPVAPVAVGSYLDYATQIMTWVVNNQGLVMGFLMALAAIWGGAQKLQRQRNRDAMDGVVQVTPTETVTAVAETLLPAARQKLLQSLIRTKRVK